MSEPFIAEVRAFGFNFAPRGWAMCDGQILPIDQYQSLYSLLGSTYGGDGRTTFALPDLRGRTPTHPGTGLALGEKDGEESVALLAGEIPNHTHSLNASTNVGTTHHATGNVLANAGAVAKLYEAPNNLTSMDTASVGSTGNTQGHDNMQPYLTINYCIALTGLFPGRN